MINTVNSEIPDIVDNLDALSLEQVCEICQVDPEQVKSMVELGVVQPVGGQPSTWTFAFYTVTRLKRACRLQRDLDLNLPGVALSLDLLDEINRLRSELNFLRTRLRE